ncbi:MAG TPA: SDR family oxidoreductase [Acidimicrobiales bacterium]|jgi:NAD(P)-dependent dehydrogenase (short-subunit alcohol dehydrogenase family)
MTGICEGRVVIVTGAGRGIGRAHALEFARQGARVVVNDVGAGLSGSRDAAGEREDGGPSAPAEEVVDTIRAMGGEAIANGDDVGSWDGAAHLVESTIAAWGRLDTLVNNAGIVRDRMIVSMGEDEWDAVMRVHLKGTFATVHHAAVHWRDRSKAGEAVDARVVNTSSGAGLAGSVGQANYSAAKAGIATFSIIAAVELARYGVTVNAIAPSARTRMTETTFSEMMAKPERGFDAMDPDNIAPLVVWLGSDQSAGVTGRVFELAGGQLGVAEGWARGPEVDKGARWDPAELGPVVRKLLEAARPPQPVYGA